MAVISIIVPVYKVEKYIHRCIDSILAQTFMDFDLILVDDGSPDNCGTICDEYAEKDSRIIVLHKENGGLSDARNKGIEYALTNSTSEWITFIDSDDWIHVRYLEYLFEAVSRNSVDISMLYMKNVTGFTADEDVPFVFHIASPEDAYLGKDGSVAAYACGRLYKKTLFAEVRFPFGKQWEDLYTTHKLLFQCDKIAVVDCELYYYFRNTDGISLAPWSPKRLTDETDAHEASMKFLKEHNYLKCYKQELLDYEKNLSSQFRAVNESKTLTATEKNQYIKIIRKKLRKALHASSRFDKDFFKKNLFRYEIAHPRLMWFYWTFTGILSKTKKHLGV